MQKNIVKSGDNTEKIKDTKEKINSQSIEESQKKAVSDETAADKLLNNEDKKKIKSKLQKQAVMYQFPTIQTHINMTVITLHIIQMLLKVQIAHML